MGKIFYNGTILTMDENNPTTEAVYVEEGVIKELGNFISLKNKFDAEVVNLNGNVMMPGFFEPHTHLDIASVFDKACYIGGIKFEKVEDIIKKIKEEIANTPKGKWIFFYGLDFLINRDLPEIDRYKLDKLSKEHPIVIMIQSMHTIYVNSLALEKIGINKDTKDTRDGHCFKDNNGEPTGVLTEQMFSIKFIQAWYNDLNKEPRQLLRELTKKYRNVGITSIWIAGLTSIFPDHMKVMNDFIKSKECPLRADYAISFTMIENGLVSLDNIIPDHPKTKFTGIKAWYDGSPYTGNMFMFDNYLENEIMQNRLEVPKNQAGERLFSKEKFYDILSKYHNLGYQLSVHSQGDRSSKEVFEIIEKILKENPREDHRHRIEHCAFIRDEEIKKAGDLGISLSFHPGHIYYYGEALRELVIGEKRTEAMMKVKDAVDNGVLISAHSDHPMYEPNPLLFAEILVNRKTKLTGRVIGSNQAISVHEAMKAITINAAKQQFREKELGSIEVGKFADFTILNENPYEVINGKLSDIKVITTYLNGEDTNNI